MTLDTLNKIINIYLQIYYILSFLILEITLRVKLLLLRNLVTHFLSVLNSTYILVRRGVGVKVIVVVVLMIAFALYWIYCTSIVFSFAFFCFSSLTTVLPTLDIENY